MNQRVPDEVSVFFDTKYRDHARYWWRGENRYSLRPDEHLPLHASLLALLEQRPAGRALDLGAGEGSDSIRLARLGYEVDAVEISSVGAEKIESFARACDVRINIHNIDARDFPFRANYDVVVCNGLLHYLPDAVGLLNAIKAHTVVGGLNVLSLFSDATPIPISHLRVPVFPDSERGFVVSQYRDWKFEFIRFERDKPDDSHPGEEHRHSFIKAIARRGPNQI